MKQRTIAGTSVGALGLGCMGMSWAYGPADRDEALRTLGRALELGVNFWDTADVYGAGENEKLLAEALKGKRDQVCKRLRPQLHFSPRPRRRRKAVDRRRDARVYPKILRT